MIYLYQISDIWLSNVDYAEKLSFKLEHQIKYTETKFLRDTRTLLKQALISISEYLPMENSILKLFRCLNPKKCNERCQDIFKIA